MEIFKELKNRSTLVHQQTTHFETYYQERNKMDELIFLESHMVAIYMLASSRPGGIGKPSCLCPRNFQVNYFN